MLRGFQDHLDSYEFYSFSDVEVLKKYQELMSNWTPIIISNKTMKQNFNSTFIRRFFTSNEQNDQKINQI